MKQSYFSIVKMSHYMTSKKVIFQAKKGFSIHKL
jgi:hypothetical protein